MEEKNRREDETLDLADITNTPQDDNLIKEDKRDKKDTEIANLKEQLIRLMAEFDNYKKRTKNDINLSKEIGKIEFLKGLLPIVDEFDIAMISVERSEDKNLVKGIGLLYSNLIDSLRKSGLREIDCAGNYDPHLHEVIMIEKSEKKPGSIIRVIKKGYMLNDIMVRPSSVIISESLEADDKKEKLEE